MAHVKPLGSSLLFIFSFALAQAHPLNLRFSAGAANYQFEGAGPSPNLIWESKPTYPQEPYIELEAKCYANERSSVKYWRAELEYLGGRRVLEGPQAVVRRLENSILYFGWGWKPYDGFAFEAGPMGIWQRHHLEDALGTDSKTKEMIRLGSYFGAFYSKIFGRWELGASGTMGILGFPIRQSAVSELEFGINRFLDQGPWAIGIKAKMGLIQLVRDQSQMGPLGSVPDAILLFRQGEIDTKIIMLTFARRI